ncbi:MAG: HU family DNA-binding protein [Actinobacteria bacterium]|nr:HU family DNA-binding protein [Actinomycetota bacterium]
MTKSEFIERFAARAGLSKKDAAAAVDAFIDVVKSALEEGEEVQFTGFGKFYVQTRNAREGINPQTKAKITIAATRVPRFSAGSALKAAVR